LDLAFAIDDLYSTGWWPGDGVACACDDDGRWFPDHSAIEDAFRGAGRSLELCSCQTTSACRAVWTDTAGIPHAVVAGDERVAGVLALAAFRRAQIESDARMNA